MDRIAGNKSVLTLGLLSALSGGAPKIGDRGAWIPRLKNGLDVTVRSAIKGHGGMADATDSELRNAILYMFRGKDSGK